MEDAVQGEEQIRPKVLVIDDSDSARSLLKRRLSVYNYEVYDTKTTTDAIAILKKQPVDVILLNTIMQSMSTYNFLVDLKEGNYKDIPIIMMSSEDDIGLLVKCIEAGAEDYLVKPLNQTLLKARLSNCISKKIARDREVMFLKKIDQGQKQIVKQEKMASLGVMISSVSKELKNPLNFVINFAQVSCDQCSEIKAKLEEAPEKIDQGLYDYLHDYMDKFTNNAHKIVEYGRNADRIIRFMLDQANTNTGEKAPGDINKVIQQTITMLFSMYKSNGMTRIPKIKTNFDSKIPHIQISVQAINKAVNNILDNAVYAVIHKYENLEDCDISITTKNESDKVTVTIRDNGGGIPADIIDKIFNPFFTTKNDAGPGLGLSSAKEVITNHSGTITVKSDDGEHTEFTITLKK